MGSSGSKRNHNNQHLPQDALMRKNAQMVKNCARQHQLSVEKMAGTLAALVKQNNRGSGVPHDKKQVEIEGVTYDMLEFVNRGGFGEIYKARSRSNNRIVAIKTMSNSPGVQEEIKNETNFLRLTKSIDLQNHPVIDYYGSKFSKEGIFIAMELAACDLMTFWFTHVAQTEPEEKFIFGLIIVVYVLRALIFLEQLNIIHGDIKPQNLVIVQYNRRFYIKLIDFGTVEKMNTMRAQLTVDAGKAHTVFFASPEFLRRDKNNMMSRHLHKKSDAWAAGLLFYILFFEKLPWQDQFEYENFCNDPRARDVVVPPEGGYKLIIELLLKKNPQHRSSAKATFRQMQAHPHLGPIVETLQEKLCPVDDVCSMKVPDNVRNDLAKLARPGHHARRSDPPSPSANSGSRRSCRYGRSCFRHDEDHRDDFAHPGDSDYHDDDEKPQCRYGASCFRRDPDHRKKYRHPSASNQHGLSTTSQGQSSKEKCRYGTNCHNWDADHHTQFSHPRESNHRPALEECWYGKGCTKQSDRDHMARFRHD